MQGLSREFTDAQYKALAPETKEKMHRILFRRGNIEYLWAGEQEAFNALYFIIENYKEWEGMVSWMCQNNLTGKKLVQMFQNESPDGGGYHMGAMYILSRMKGSKNELLNVNITDLQ